ncbi:cysteine desulfurase family protein [Corynebacterium sp. S7]
MIYLDNAATTAPRREAIEAMWPYLTSDFGNPSSQHRVGHAAAEGLKAARKSVAESLGARASEIIFTSGGTEADNLAIKGIALANPRGKHIVTTRLEHAAVLESVDYLVRFHGFEVSFAEPDEFGRITPAALQAVLREDTTLVSIHFANNEIGTIQPIRELVSGVPFHTDAVQAAGLNLNVRELGVDALSLSGHKLGAPKGTGVLWVRGSVALEPVLHGGGQERGLRSGTENVAGAVALATALRLSLHDDHLRTTGLRDNFIRTVLTSVPGARLTGHPTERVPGSASFVFEGVGGEAVLLELEERGIMCSSGSACDADSEDASPVLLAIGIPEDLARTAVRFTFSPTTTEEDAETAARAVVDAVAAVRGLG